MSSNTETGNQRLVPIAIIGALFFIMGWFTWINGPLISFVQLAFEQMPFGHRVGVV